MRIVTIGRGNIGGGLAKLWRAAGHDVDEFGQDGGDASGADVLLVAVPSDAIDDALAKVSGIDGKVAIDATNALGGRKEGFESLAEQVKSIVGGPTAKAFNLNFARLYDQVREQDSTPTTPYAADDDAGETTEQLIRDAGYDPFYCGGLDNARALEDALGLVFAALQASDGPVFFRMAKPGEL